MEKWVTIKIPTALLIEVGKFLETRGKKLGFPTKTQFISEAVREKLNKPSEQRLFEELAMMDGRLDQIYEMSKNIPYRVHSLLMSNEGELKDELKIKAKNAKSEKLLEKTSG